MKTCGVLVLFSAFVCLPLFAYQDVTLTFKGKPVVVSNFNWGDGTSCASGQIHFTVTGDGAATFVQACHSNEQIPAVQFDYMNTRHVLQGARVSCENNLFTIHFNSCALHPKTTPIAASMVPQPAALAPTYDSLLLGDSLAENAKLVSLRPESPTSVVIVQKAAPAFFKNCVAGAHYKKVTLQMRKAGGSQQEYFKVTLSDVLVSSYSRTADGSTSIKLNFARSDAPLTSYQDVH